MWLLRITNLPLKLFEIIFKIGPHLAKNARKSIAPGPCSEIGTLSCWKRRTHPRSDVAIIGSADFDSGDDKTGVSSTAFAKSGSTIHRLCLDLLTGLLMPSVTDWTSIVTRAFCRHVFLLGCCWMPTVDRSVGFSVWILQISFPQWTRRC